MTIKILYGSQTRGDIDNLSDCDMMIVGEKHHYEEVKPNSDITYYTKKRLKALQRSESLFLVHIKKEGVILEDENGWFKSFINSIDDFIPKQTEITKVKTSLKTLLELGRNNSTLGCWYDSVFIFLRDLLIKLNAQQGNYIFSTSELTNHLPVNSRSEVKKVLTEARIARKAYKNNTDYSSKLPFNYIVNTLVNAFNLELESQNIKQAIESNLKSDPYLTLRIIEYGWKQGLIEVNCNVMEKYLKHAHRYTWGIKHQNWLNIINFKNNT